MCFSLAEIITSYTFLMVSCSMFLSVSIVVL